MESREGNASGVTVIAAEAPSIYHVAPRTENSVQVTGTPQMNPSLFSASSSGSLEKKKRGRPRKYGPEGGIARPISPMPISSSAPPATGNFSAEKPSGSRPIGSEKKQKQKVGPEKLGEWIMCSSGGSFTPHMITVNAGEDVTMKIISFSQQGPRAICIISAVGLISNVTLRQPDSSGGTLTYEGRFEILSLSGSFTPTEVGGSRAGRSGGMSISLASPDGRVVGGLLGGLLIAASPVQVVVGSFVPSSQQELKPKKQKPEPKSVPAPAYPPITSIMEPKSFMVQDRDNSADQNPNNASSSSFHTEHNWTSLPVQDLRKSSATDINISLHGS